MTPLTILFFASLLTEWWRPPAWSACFTSASRAPLSPTSSRPTLLPPQSRRHMPDHVSGGGYLVDGEAEATAPLRSLVPATSPSSWTWTRSGDCSPLPRRPRQQTVLACGRRRGGGKSGLLDSIAEPPCLLLRIHGTLCLEALSFWPTDHLHSSSHRRLSGASRAARHLAVAALAHALALSFLLA